MEYFCKKCENKTTVIDFDWLCSSCWDFEINKKYFNYNLFLRESWINNVYVKDKNLFLIIDSQIFKKINISKEYDYIDNWFHIDIKNIKEWENLIKNINNGYYEKIIDITINLFFRKKVFTNHYIWKEIELVKKVKR